MARIPARRTEDPTDWTRNREVARLTKEILALQREAGAKVVATVVAMGDRMRQIRKQLEPGQWLSWVETAMPFTPRTIQSAIRLSEWAETEPRELTRLEHLGPSKLYHLVPLAPDIRRKLTGRVPIVIPGHDRPKTIETMTVIDLKKVIGDLTDRPAPPKPIGKLVAGLRHRVAGLDVLADELVRRKDEVDPEQVEEVLEGLEEVLEALRGAFEE
ncbi:DUF3102 domain-containing protein [Paraliomyxa miuraensis]|uniref:DUF3102 domain-containing protein n=1 Tax=Paraliomyxa miuraensis TaxID=376150 RepID=UPI0022578C38|nr:DUF3102 domain-containing protein [Paraliomyxa miuraensis]MCX4239386.1 DUF3102 domain-containing protein [Paraliomyxa miuraensis]